MGQGAARGQAHTGWHQAYTGLLAGTAAQGTPEEGKEAKGPEKEVSGKPVPTKGWWSPSSAWTVLSHPTTLMALVRREARLLTSPE